MAKEYFDFKKFRVYQDQCAMKVGTDGVLLGAWTPIDVTVQRILDVGTGTGLVALMLAQRSCAYIVGVEIDADASKQAASNVFASPFSDRIRIVHADIMSYQSADKFELVVCNPPFFQSSLQSPDEQRNMARHCEFCLTFENLIINVRRLIQPQGSFVVIIPKDAEKDFLDIAATQHFTLARRLSIFTTPRKPSKRVILSLCYTTEALTPVEETLLLAGEGGAQRSEAYALLTQDFYL